MTILFKIIETKQKNESTTLFTSDKTL